MKKAQISVEFIIILAVLLLFVFLVVTNIYQEINNDRVLLSLKTKTIDLINRDDSSAYLENMNFEIEDNNLKVIFYINRNGSDISLSEIDYSDTIASINQTTNIKDVNLIFNYSN